MAYALPVPPVLPPRTSRLSPLRPRLSGGYVGGAILLLIFAACFLTLPWSIHRYGVDLQAMAAGQQLHPPTLSEPAMWLGTDENATPLLWRCLLGGAISLTIGITAAGVAVVIGTLWGGVAGYLGGRTDAVMMRIVDVLYGLPYILLVVLISMALQPAFETLAGLWLDPMSAIPPETVAGVLTLLLAIGGVSWLTMARVIRGQVLSLRAQPFVEAARAGGVGPLRVLRRHLLPNLVGPIVVYATLSVPAAILQESFLSFLTIGVRGNIPSWGKLASVAPGVVMQLFSDPSRAHWWLLLFPCLLLAVTLMSLNFLGDSLRAALDPREGG